MKMIVTDLDKTLLRQDKTLSEYTKSILNQCHKNGHIIVYATARPERATRQWQVDTQSGYVIANNGACIKQGSKVIQNINISEEVKHSILSRFVSDKNITGVCAETGDCLYSDDNNYWSWSAAYPADAGWNLVHYDFRLPIKEDICKISVECDNPDRILRILQDYPELHIFSNHGENWYQITHHTASKFKAINSLLEMVHVSLQDVIAFGDDDNDIEMLEKCGIGIAVENAVPNARQVADFICESNDHDGVAKYLEKYILSSEQHL